MYHLIEYWTEDGEEGHLKGTQDEPFSGLVFKIMNDPFVGQLSYMRVYSGELKTGDTVLNNRKERPRGLAGYYSSMPISGKM